MNVLIDRENLLILRKLDNSTGVLSKLCDMECPHVATLLIRCDRAADFDQLSDLELKLLIKNANGPDARSVFSRATLLHWTHQIVHAMPESVVNAFEVDMQWRTVDINDPRRYQYVPGSMVPKLAEGLAELAGMRAANVLGVPASVPSAPVHTTPAASTPNPVPGPAADDFVMPKAGTSTHTIFMFCAERWKEAGYVDDKGTLDNIRKKAVETLVSQGLNISTVRTQAARWYQHRQRLVL